MTQGKNLEEILERRISFKFLENSISRSKALIIIMVTAIVLIAIVILLGNYYLRGGTGYYDRRISDLQQSLTTHPGNVETALELAMTLYLKGEADKGIKLAEEVYQNNPMNKNVLFDLALMLSDSGKYQESQNFLLRLVKLYPNYEVKKVTYYLGRNAFEIQDYSQAVKHLETAARLDTGSPVTYYYLGKAYLAVGRKDQATTALQQAIRLVGKYPEAETLLKEIQ